MKRSVDNAKRHQSFISGISALDRCLADARGGSLAECCIHDVTAVASELGFKSPVGIFEGAWGSCVTCVPGQSFKVENVLLRNLLSKAKLVADTLGVGKIGNLVFNSCYSVGSRVTPLSIDLIVFRSPTAGSALLILSASDLNR